MTSQKKQRGPTKVITGDVMFHITEVAETGEPIGPKNIANNFVSQCGAVVRDRMPISVREWKGKATNPYVLPDTSIHAKRNVVDRYEETLHIS